MIRPLSNSLNCEKCLLARLPGMFRLPKSSYNRQSYTSVLACRLLYCDIPTDGDTLSPLSARPMSEGTKEEPLNTLKGDIDGPIPWSPANWLSPIAWRFFNPVVIFEITGISAPFVEAIRMEILSVMGQITCMSAALAVFQSSGRNKRSRNPFMPNSPRAIEFWAFHPGSATFNPYCPIRWTGYCSPVVRVSDHGRHVMSSSPVPLKTTVG
ncbi:hypothetical protein TNCV_3170751 [Trichonephila clavipes]|nr:hypothetical protein TNCV_3170751 [Trichonephila clavipes]